MKIIIVRINVLITFIVTRNVRTSMRKFMYCDKKRDIFIVREAVAFKLFYMFGIMEGLRKMHFPIEKYIEIPSFFPCTYFRFLAKREFWVTQIVVAVDSSSFLFHWIAIVFTPSNNLVYQLGKSSSHVFLSEHLFDHYRNRSFSRERVVYYTDNNTREFLKVQWDSNQLKEE